MTKFYDDVYSFEPVRGCQFLKLYKIDVWEMAGVTAMAAGGEQTQSAHACDVSLGARIGPVLLGSIGLHSKQFSLN